MYYWKYYKDDFNWDHNSFLPPPDLTITRQRFSEMGLSASEAESFVKSGYVLEEIGDNIIDRYYGGALLSSDLRTHISTSHFVDWYKSGINNVPVCHAKSITEVFSQIEKWRAESRKPLLFRGQTEHYPLTRECPNPYFQIKGLGEISLLPSLWRNMQKVNPNSFHQFCNLTTGEWTKIVTDAFNHQEIRQRIEKIRQEGGWIFNNQDLEDSDDPLLKEYGGICLDMSYGHGVNLAATLSTLLQHYGLYSPVLDLTSDLEVALFFASHKLVGGKYNFVGSNHRESILYVFREDKKEMNAYEHERALHELKPLRPVRQSCVICTSAPYALNLAADFIIGVIKMDFDDLLPRKYTVSDLFPGESEDNFLAALKKHLLHSQYVTDFSVAH